SLSAGAHRFRVPWPEASRRSDGRLRSSAGEDAVLVRVHVVEPEAEAGGDEDRGDQPGDHPVGRDGAGELVLPRMTLPALHRIHPTTAIVSSSRSRGGALVA